MKTTNIYRKLFLPAFVMLMGGLSSCDDFLTLYPSNKVTDEQFWEDKSDLESVLGAAYLNMSSNLVSNAIVLGECRSDNFIQGRENVTEMKDLMNANLLPTSGLFNWASFYKTINYANKVLEHGDVIIAKDPSFSEGDWKPIKAEAMAVRALNYFYLVRAFRDVPYIDHSIDTDTEVTKPTQTPARTILNNIITDLESVKDDGMVDYGNSVYNKGRFTRWGIYSLLADVYLWRASLTSDSLANANVAQEDYAKCAEYSKLVIDEMKTEYDKNNNSMNGSGSGSSSTTTQEYPLITMKPTMTSFSGQPFSEIFGQGNSSESIYEIQFDGDNTKNSAVVGYFYILGQGPVAYVTPSSLFQGLAAKPEDEDRVYSVTDLRQWENTLYESSGQKEFQVSKYAYTSVITKNGENVKEGAIYSGYRTKDACAANWIVYRLSDVMLMRAEALAQLDGAANIAEAFKLVNAIFMRSNPLYKENNGSLLETSYTTKELMETLVMKERQREFYAEGKRWFDLVRYAERCGSTKKMLELLVKKYPSNSTAIKSKLGTMNSLYSPVYKNEIKANGNLKQNPAWVTDETITKN